MAQQKGAETKGADKMKTCMDGQATAASKTMATATATEKNTWRQTCSTQAKAEFEAAGGKAGDWELAKRDGAKSKGADKMKTCVEAKATAASKTMATATATEKDGWRQTCSDEAKAEFEAAGGKAGDWELAKREGARSKGADKMKTCVD